jgi:hypothetical protein
MYLQGTAQKGQGLNNSRHWGKYCLSDDGLLKASCKDIQHRRENNSMMNLLSKNPWDMLWEVERGLCKSDQGDK